MEFPWWKMVWLIKEKASKAMGRGVGAEARVAGRAVGSEDIGRGAGPHPRQVVVGMRGVFSVLDLSGKDPGRPVKWI